MTRIDFYQIDTAEPAFLFACRLIEKAWRQGHRVYIHVGTSEDCGEMDNLLWSFRPDRFIPHDVGNTSPAGPVHIGYNGEPGTHNDVLVNLSGEVPEFFSRFTRVAEVVPLDAEQREKARTNYRFYRDRGYPLQYHSISSR
jgi:DNA polymerase-3 subunit chi